MSICPFGCPFGFLYSSELTRSMAASERRLGASPGVQPHEKIVLNRDGFSGCFILRPSITQAVPEIVNSGALGVGAVNEQLLGILLEGKKISFNVSVQKPNFKQSFVALYLCRNS